MKNNFYKKQPPSTIYNTNRRPALNPNPDVIAIDVSNSNNIKTLTGIVVEKSHPSTGKSGLWIDKFLLVGNFNFEKYLNMKVEAKGTEYLHPVGLIGGCNTFTVDDIKILEKPVDTPVAVSITIEGVLIKKEVLNTNSGKNETSFLVNEYTLMGTFDFEKFINKKVKLTGSVKNIPTGYAPILGFDVAEIEEVKEPVFSKSKRNRNLAVALTCVVIIIALIFIFKK